MTTPKLRLTKAETYAHCLNLLISGKLSELIAFSGRYKAPKHWIDKAKSVTAALAAQNVPEDLFTRYVEATCSALQLYVLTTWYRTLDKDPTGSGVCLELTVSKKHITEGGRVAEEISALNQLRYLQFTAEECRILAPVTVVVLVDQYSDDDDDDDDEEQPLEGEETECDCPSCSRYDDEDDATPDTRH